MKEEKPNKIYKHCEECYGSIEGFSVCCDEEVDLDGKCGRCGKFCKTHPCLECYGDSPWLLEVGDPVEIFVYKNSPKYLKEQFDVGKLKSRGKFYKGKISEIIDNNTIRFKFSTRSISNNSEIIVGKDDLEII